MSETKSSMLKEESRGRGSGSGLMTGLLSRLLDCHDCSALCAPALGRTVIESSSAGCSASALMWLVVVVCTSPILLVSTCSADV